MLNIKRTLDTREEYIAYLEAILSVLSNRMLVVSEIANNTQNNKIRLDCLETTVRMQYLYLVTNQLLFNHQEKLEKENQEENDDDDVAVEVINETEF